MSFRQWLEIIMHVKYENFIKFSDEEKETYYIQYEFEYPTIIDQQDI